MGTVMQLPQHNGDLTPPLPAHLDDGLDAAVLLDQRQRAHGADAADVGCVVAAAHDAQVDELLHAELRLGQQHRQVDLHDGRCAGRLHSRTTAQSLSAHAGRSQHSQQHSQEAPSCDPSPGRCCAEVHFAVHATRACFCQDQLHPAATTTTARHTPVTP